MGKPKKTRGKKAPKDLAVKDTKAVKGGTDIKLNTSTSMTKNYYNWISP